jgi:hypothetical protein
LPDLREEMAAVADDMRIAFLGNFQQPHCSEVHHARTLEQLGHEVIRLQEGINGDQVLAYARDTDLFVWVHSHGAAPTTMTAIPRVLHELQRREVTTCTYHLDLYKGIPSRFLEYQNHPFMTELDYFFSVDPPLVDWINNTPTRTQAHYLTAGVLKDECHTADPSDRPYLTPPVIFVGSYHYHQEWPYRKQLIDWLKQTYQDDFQGFGPNFGAVVRGHELNELYAAAKIVVGDSFSPNFNYPGYWSDRIPETLGRGGFLIHPRIEGIENYFEDRKHLVLYTYGDFVELRHLIDYYMRRDDEREAIRLAGHQHVKANHTFTNRWETILETVKQ